MSTIESLGGNQPHVANTPPPARRINEEPAAVAAPAALPNHFSPIIRVDKDTGLAVLVQLNSQTGDVVSQVPQRQAVEEYRRHMETPASGAVPAVGATTNAAAPSEHADSGHAAGQKAVGG